MSESPSTNPTCDLVIDVMGGERITNPQLMGDCDLRAEMIEHLKGKSKQAWRYVFHIAPDGTTVRLDGARFENGRATCDQPDRFTERDVLVAMVSANRRVAERRSKAAHSAAATRKRRHDLKVGRVVEELRWGKKFGPRRDCYICRKPLSDDASRERGIGPECWQGALAVIETRRVRETRSATERHEEGC